MNDGEIFFSLIIEGWSGARTRDLRLSKHGALTTITLAPMLSIHHLHVGPLTYTMRTTAVESAQRFVNIRVVRIWINITLTFHDNNSGFWT